ncbi:MAG: hypothetical protein NT052_01740, partial [Candidatus Shapirobacteria bacterium]|nr:hypothetical protein [Candidatus Shapirobacteria bacterium]
NAQEGKYQIKVNGTGQGEYQLHIGQIINNKDIWTTTSGFINPGEEIIHEINFNVSSPLENPLFDQTGREYIKSARNKLIDLKNKTNQENINQTVKRTMLTQLNQIIRLLDSNKDEDPIVSLYRLRYQINLWQSTRKLDENNSHYFINKIQEIIEDLEDAYVIIETNKGASYNSQRLIQEIKLAQKSFGKIEDKLQKLYKKGIVKPDYGALYLLVQKKLNKALNPSASNPEIYINLLGVKFLSQEILSLK